MFTEERIDMTRLTLDTVVDEKQKDGGSWVKPPASALARTGSFGAVDF